MRMAQEAGVPVIPVALWGTQRLWTKGRPKDLRRSHIPVTLRVGEPMEAPKDQYAGALTRRLRGRVEELLDACHALMDFGVNRYRHPKPLSPADELRRHRERQEYSWQQYDEIWRTLPANQASETGSRRASRFPEEPQENLLYFVEKHCRGFSRGSASWCGSCARWRSISIPRASPRS